MSRVEKKIQTLGLVCENGRILLGMKKRGFGAGKWNGFGGHVEEGETIEQAMAREFQEEAGVNVESFEKSGVINFHFSDKPIQPEVHIFRIKKYSGKPVESDEMKPKWFDINKIPYDSMWVGDDLWLPLFLAGKRFEGEVYFKKDESIRFHTIKPHAICSQ